MAEILMTAEEAYPAFERIVLAARDEVLISMRIFDPATRLRHATDIGKTWADLIAHKLAEGVRFDITITDFDPIARPAMHRYSWECRAALDAAAARHPERMTARVHMHPATVSFPQRIALARMTQSKLAEECARLDALPDVERRTQLSDMPLFRKLIVEGQPLRPRRWPPAALRPATHHQKMAVVDGEVLYIGGLDLNPRRYDSPDRDRPSDQTWHDIQVILRGAPAGSARAHLRGFIAATEGGPLPDAPGLLRTLSCRNTRMSWRLGPQEVLRELEETHLKLIDGAERYIYAETQFLRSSVITDALVGAADRGVDLIIMLPAAPDDVAFDGSDALDARFGEQLQADAVSKLTDAFGDRLFIGAPAKPASKDGDRDTLENAPIIYIHAKAIVVDGAQAIVSSANLNGRSMRWDTETGVLLGREDSQKLMRRCLDHWFRGTAPDDMIPAADWSRAARENKARAPQDRPHFVLPYDPEPAEDMGQNLPGIPEELV